MDDEINFTKVIEQGYSVSVDDTITYHIGENGDKYRDNYIDIFLNHFQSIINE